MPEAVSVKDTDKRKVSATISPARTSVRAALELRRVDSGAKVVPANMECLRQSAVDVMVSDGLHAGWGWPCAEELAAQHRPRPQVLRNVLMTCGLIMFIAAKQIMSRGWASSTPGEPSWVVEPFFRDSQVSHELCVAIGALSSSGAVVTMLLLIALMFHSHMATKLVLEEARAIALGKARAITQRHVERLFVALHTRHRKQSLFRPERIWLQQKTETSAKTWWSQCIVRAKDGSVSFGEHYKFQCPLQIRA